MLSPSVSDITNIKISTFLETIGRQKIFCPRTKRPAQPVSKRDGKAHLWSVVIVLWQVSLDDSSQQPFALRISDLEMPRHAPAELGDPMVKKRRPCFEANSHGCAIHLH